jgi:nucleotide-binding universal stress UspA family protein
MKNVLVHIEVDHEVRTRSAIEQAARLYRQEPCTVYLLHVQPSVSGHVAMYFASTELKDLLCAFGNEDMRLAESLLDAAKIPYTTLVRIGRTASTIANVAKELNCDRIIFGVEEPGLAERLLGSLAHQVRHLLQAQGDPQVLGS